MAQLYAACRPIEELEVRHVQLTAAVQDLLEPFFEAQLNDFEGNVDEEIEFTGDWTPDGDQVLVVRDLPEARVLLEAVARNAVALPPLDIARFGEENIRALFTNVGDGANRKLLLQNFTLRQILSRRFTLLNQGDVFRRLTEPAFTLADSLVAIVSADGTLRFKSYAMARRVFELGEAFRVATDRELRAFCELPTLAVADVNAFVDGADEVIRRNVMAIARTRVLLDNQLDAVRTVAARLDFPLVIADGRITIPNTRRETKALLGFLLDKVYRGSFDQRLFITNSNRPLA